MDISQIRRQNMLALLDNYKTQIKFATAIDKPASYISQLKRGTKPNGEAIGMGNDFARDIEESLGLKHGWMDVLHINESAIEQELIHSRRIPARSNTRSDNSKSSDHIIIGGRTEYPLVNVKYLDIKASCGNGYINIEHPESHTQAFTVEFLRANELPIDGIGLVLMHACSDSMGNTIPHGTPMLVNTNESEFDNFINNKIYVFNADGEMMCKRTIKNLDGTVVLKSDNADKDNYPDQLITRDSFNQFSLFGRVRYSFLKH